MISSYVSGPGVLTLGSGPLDVSPQVEKCTLKWNETVETTPRRPTLDGDAIPKEETPSYGAVLEVQVVQDDLSASGLIVYSIEHMGENVAFHFEPNSTLDNGFTGVLCVHPIDVGGENEKRNPSTVTFRCIGIPEIVPNA